MIVWVGYNLRVDIEFKFVKLEFMRFSFEIFFLLYLEF